MKALSSSTQRGQALVLIALAAIGLFSFAALAIDGSAVFSDRRHSQNASDTAAYAAALARVRDPNPALGNWKQSGIDRAASNGYDESDGVTKVYVHSCDDTSVITDEGIQLTCQGLPAGADPAEYVHVYIKSVVKLFFARVIGWQQVINHTDAVVHASPADINEWFDGKALVSTKKDCPKPGDNYVPFVAGGSGNTVVTNSGIFVNADCPDSFEDSGSGNFVSTDPSAGICLVGGYDSYPPLSGISPAPTENCGSQVDMSEFWMPDSNPPNLLAAYCSQPGSITGSGGDYEAWPGYFNKTGNQTFPDVSPSGTLKLHRGIYCLYNGMSLNGNWTITTDLNDNGSHDSDTEGVFFYVPGGDVIFNGGSYINIHAINSTAGGIDSRLLNYLIYIPPSNAANLTISGNNGSTFTGTILAPTSHITLDGSGNAFDLHTQIIGYNTTITGNGNIDITYDPDDNAPAIKLPSISPTK
jgi:hypothetical protein